jgi:hypothetical protein
MTLRKDGLKDSLSALFAGTGAVSVGDGAGVDMSRAANEDP